jgi:hypothetical protein
MALPDMNSPTRVEGKFVTVAVGTATGTNASLILTAPNSAVCRIVSLVAANVDGTNAADITLTVDTTAVHNTIAVPADASLTLADKVNVLHLQENQSLRAIASAAGDLRIGCSYEEIT